MAAAMAETEARVDCGCYAVLKRRSSTLVLEFVAVVLIFSGPRARGKSRFLTGLSARFGMTSLQGRFAAEPKPLPFKATDGTHTI
jgi:hypothetical protein